MTGGLAAVTGGSGFIGRRLVSALIARGWRVKALARGASTMWEGPQPDVVRGDLGDTAALAALVRNADVLIHGAGLIKARTRDGFLAVNAVGARAVAQAALNAGVSRVAQISSLAAREPTLSDYAHSKAVGETAAREVLGERLRIVRPPAVYGPGDRETLGLFQLAGRSPFLPAPADRAARLALAHVDDVVADIIDAIEGVWRPGTFAFGGARPEGYGWREIFTTAASSMGRAPVLVPTPGWAIAAAGAAAETLGRMRGAPVIFNRGKARELLHPDWSVRAAESAPDPIRPCLDLRAGFDHTVAWYRRAGWL